jgi:hypothetical protein
LSDDIENSLFKHLDVLNKQSVGKTATGFACLLLLSPSRCCPLDLLYPEYSQQWQKFCLPQAILRRGGAASASLLTATTQQTGAKCAGVWIGLGRSRPSISLNKFKIVLS